MRNSDVPGIGTSENSLHTGTEIDFMRHPAFDPDHAVPK